ncbi:MAG: response regulator [Verrucomicrobiota bacterium]
MDTTFSYIKTSRDNLDSRKSHPPDGGEGQASCLKGILIVEDDPAIRSLLRTILESAHYRIFEADSESQAFRIWNKYFCHIDLLITDICIPYQTTGVELAKKLREEKSWLKVIYTTGFSPEIVEQDSVSLIENVNFFGKPFSSGKLLEALRASFAKTGAHAD